MSIAFSSIAWDPSEDEAVAAALRGAGVAAVELAPTKLWADLTAVPAPEAAAVRSAWERQGLPIVALQALLYGRPDLRLFGSPSERDSLHSYLDAVMGLGQRLGARVLVFGSPKNRQREQRTLPEASAIAQEFFTEVGERAVARDLVLCIEPNPKQYDCDFVTTARAGLELVEAVGHPGFRLHLDAACMTLAGDPIGESIEKAAPVLCHFHASEPELRSVGGPDSAVTHDEAAAALDRAGYRAFVSVEMRPPPPDERLVAIKTAASFAVRTYQRGG